MAARKADHPLQRCGSARALAFATLYNLHHFEGHNLSTHGNPALTLFECATIMKLTCGMPNTAK
jgi:hypothetical protein